MSDGGVKPFVRMVVTVLALRLPVVLPCVGFVGLLDFVAVRSWVPMDFAAACPWFFPDVLAYGALQWFLLWRCGMSYSMLVAA